MLESQVLRPALASKGGHPCGLSLPRPDTEVAQSQASGCRAVSPETLPTERGSRSPSPTPLLSPAKVNHVKSLNLSQLVLTTYTWTDSFNFYFFKLKTLDTPVSEKYF